LLGLEKNEIVDGRFVILKYAIEDYSNIKECKLYTDSKGNDFYDEPSWAIGGFTEQGIEVFVEFLQDGVYEWGVVCEDFQGNKNELERKTFVVENGVKEIEKFTVKILPDLSEEMVNYVVTKRDVDFIYLKEYEEKLNFEKLEIRNYENEVIFSKEYSEFNCIDFNDALGEYSNINSEVVYCNYHDFSLDPNDFLEDGFEVGNDGYVIYLLYYNFEGKEMVEEVDMLIKVTEKRSNQFGQ